MRTEEIHVWCEQCGREITPKEVQLDDVFEVFVGRKRQLSTKATLDDVCTTCYLQYMKAIGPLIDDQKYHKEVAESDAASVPEEEVESFFDNLKEDDSIFTAKEGEYGVDESL